MGHSALPAARPDAPLYARAAASVPDLARRTVAHCVAEVPFNDAEALAAMLDARGSDPAIDETWEQWIESFVAPLTAEVDEKRSADPDAVNPPSVDLVTALLGANERAFERLSRSRADPDRVERCLDALTYLWLSTVVRRQL
jgi:hypothetical protein